MLLVSKLKDDLHVLQYPLRPNYRAYGDQGELTKVEVCVSSELKGGNAFDQKYQKVINDLESFKFHFKLNQESNNFDRCAVDNMVMNRISLTFLDLHSLR